MIVIINYIKPSVKKFAIKTLGEYHDLYLKSDVLLLADVFENFRETCFSCFQYYKLDPAHYYSAPGLSWECLFENDWHRIRVNFRC